MAQYNFRRSLRAQASSRASASFWSPRKKLWSQGILLLVLFLLAVGYTLPSAAWTKIGLPDPSKESYRLGLDLRGGTHLVYEADMASIPLTDRGDALEGVRDVIERRVNSLGVSEPHVESSSSGGTYRVIAELAGVTDVNEAINQIGETPVLEFKEPGESTEGLTDEQFAELEKLQEQERADAKTKLAEVRRNRSFGDLETSTLSAIAPSHPLYGPLVSGVVDQRLGEGSYARELVENQEGINILRLDNIESSTQWDVSHLLVCYEGKTRCGSDRSELDATLRLQTAMKDLTAENFAERTKEFSDDAGSAQNGGRLNFLQPGETVAPFEEAMKALPVNAISDVVETEFGYHVILKHAEKPLKTYTMTRALLKLSLPSDIAPNQGAWKNTALSGKNLKRATVVFDPTTGAPSVSLQFDSEGDKMFGDLTARLVNKQIAIFLDGEVISAPVVQQAIYGGEAIITGNFSVEEAKLLAQRLNAGALPVPVKLLSQQTVGPTLGAAFLQKSLVAGLVGFALVALFMILYYRLPGVISILSLAMYAGLNLAAYKIFDVTLTLAGIAGFILTLGMAVDANVLIFERMKEELRAGRDIAGAIHEGFHRAWTSIRDGNATTLITALILFLFSTSFIKGFAITLTIGILLSMFSAISVSRVLLLLISRVRIFSSRWLYGVRSNSTL